MCVSACGSAYLSFFAMCAYMQEPFRCYESQGWQHDRGGEGEVRTGAEEGYGECISSSGQVFLSRPLTTAVLHVWWKPCAAIFVPQWWGGTNGYFHTSWCHQHAASGEQECGIPAGSFCCPTAHAHEHKHTHICKCSYEVMSSLVLYLMLSSETLRAGNFKGLFKRMDCCLCWKFN